MKTIPTLDECRQILHETGVGEQVKEHSCMVAFIAKELTNWLNRAGAGLDKDLILDGVLLHNAARSRSDRAQAGVRSLEARGYPLVAEIVGGHMDTKEVYPLTEAEIVFLADKMVYGRYIVSVKDSFAAELEKYKDDPQVCAAVVKRLKEAERIIMKIGKITGRSIESVPVSDFHLKKLCRERDEMRWA